MVIYTGFRVVGGVGFAMLKSSTPVLLVRVFGSENVARISGTYAPPRWINSLGGLNFG